MAGLAFCFVLDLCLGIGMGLGIGIGHGDWDGPGCFNFSHCSKVFFPEKKLLLVY